MIADLHRVRAPLKHQTKGLGVVPDQCGRRGVPGKGFGELPCQPFRSRMPGHRYPDDLAPQVSQDHQGIEAFEVDGRYRQQIERERDDAVGVIAEKGPPAQW